MGKRLTETHEDCNALFARLRAGDRQALAESFSRNRERLWRTVQFRLDHRLQGRVDPDDILQEAYLAATKRVGHVEANSLASLYVWLRMIVIQTMIDVHRRHVGAQRRDADREIHLRDGHSSQNTSSCLAIQLSGKLTSPSQAAMREERIRQLEEVLEQMDSADREVLALRHFEEMANSEVAAVLGIQQKAASIRYVRALRRLKAIMSQLSDFADER